MLVFTGLSMSIVVRCVNLSRPIQYSLTTWKPCQWSSAKNGKLFRGKLTLLLTSLYSFWVHGSVHRFLCIYTQDVQQDATLVSWFYYKITLHVSGTFRTHHQEYNGHFVCTYIENDARNHEPKIQSCCHDIKEMTTGDEARIWLRETANLRTHSEFKKTQN
jgi:hypothetical protein